VNGVRHRGAGEDAPGISRLLLEGAQVEDVLVPEVGTGQHPLLEGHAGPVGGERGHSTFPISVVTVRRESLLRPWQPAAAGWTVRGEEAGRGAVTSRPSGDGDFPYALDRAKPTGISFDPYA
jgi:hypothetical protein